MNNQFRAIDKWPHPETENRRSRHTFKAGWNDTLSQLDRELTYLDAESVVFQVACDRSQIRLDGMLRAKATVSHPGAILSFESPKGSLSFPCDSCELWQHNFRSIALGLAALRAVDRYGITQRNEQYRGWDALPSPDGDGALWEVPTNIVESLAFISKVIEQPARNDASTLLLAKNALLRFHPDHGGDGRMFRAMNAAIGFLKESLA